MGVMNVMNRTGHTKHIWNKDVEDEVEAARDIFDTLTEKGYRAFNVKKDGESGTRMDRFDPTAEKMILAPQLQGG
jgi:hypothetical protein